MSNPWLTKTVLLFGTLFLVASCKTQSKVESINKQPKPLHGQIILWAEMPLRLTEAQGSKSRQILTDMVEQFSKLYPQVQVFVKFFPSMQILEPFELQAKRGAGPDLLLVYSSPKILRLIQTGAFAAIDESEIDQSQFRRDALKGVRYRGKLYGLPIYLSTQLLCYNQDKVKKLPKTLPELIEQARQGYSVGLLSGFTETFWGTGVFGGRLLDDRARVILAQGRGWAKWMEWLKEAQNEPNFILSDDAEALKQAFVDRKLAYLTCTPGWIPYLSRALGKNKLGATLLPAGVNQPATPALWTVSLLFNRASHPNQSRIALKLAQFLTNAEQQKQVEAEIPFIPTNKNITINRSLFPIRAVMLDQSKTAVATSLDDSERIEVIKEYGDMIYQQVLAGELAPDEAATRLTLKVNRQFGWGE